MTEKQMISTLKGLTFGTVVGSKGVEALEMAIQALSQEPCDDAISRILKRMWNCRGKHTTSIDKVAMEQIIRDELPSVTQKSGKWEDLHRCWVCSECGQQTHIEHKYCPNCGCRMVEPQESDIEKRKPCINYEDECEEWAGCPCVYYKAESEE